MESNVGRENSQYRRGLVLGLTLAEIMVLIIFLLLLALSILAAELDDKIAAAERQRDSAESQLQEVRLRLSLPLSASGSQDDLFLELKRMKEAAARELPMGSELAAAGQLVQQVKKSFSIDPADQETASAVLGQVARAVESFPQAAPATNGSGQEKPIEAAEQFSDAISTLGSWIEAKRSSQGTDPGEPVASLLGGLLSCDEDYRALLDSVKTDGGLDVAGAITDARADANNARGQLKNLEMRLEECTGGAGPPPCWAVAETGKAEYIFDAALKADGIVLKDNALPHRRREQERLPIEDIEFGRTYPESQFLAVTLPLLNWSKDHDCIFYVRVFDEIDNRKDVFKQKLRTLEGRFYKYEVRDSKFGATRSDLE